MEVRIYCPARTATQSGRGKAGRWCLDWGDARDLYQEPLMGWTGGRSMRPQIDLTFESAEAAAAYLERQGFAYKIDPPAKAPLQSKKYADNFTAHPLL